MQNVRTLTYPTFPPVHPTPCSLSSFQFYPLRSSLNHRARRPRTSVSVEVLHRPERHNNHAMQSCLRGRFVTRGPFWEGEGKGAPPNLCTLQDAEIRQTSTWGGKRTPEEDVVELQPWRFSCPASRENEARAIDARASQRSKQCS